MIRLTANQLITLLQIYRGTLADEMQVGTFQNDLKHLEAEGFINNNGVGTGRAHPTNGYNVTQLATIYIKTQLLGERDGR